MFIHLQPKQCIILYVIIFKGDQYQAVAVLLFMFLHYTFELYDFYQISKHF